MHKSILWSLTFVFTEIRAIIHWILRRQLKWLHNSRHAQRWEKSGECFDFIATFLWPKHVSIMCLSDCVMNMLDWWNHELCYSNSYFVSCRVGSGVHRYFHFWPKNLFNMISFFSGLTCSWNINVPCFVHGSFTCSLHETQCDNVIAHVCGLTLCWANVQDILRDALDNAWL
jgi:hypothetical protein